MCSYQRVTYEDRCQIKAYLDVKLSKAEIARRLGFHKSTICRELKRNGFEGYQARRANKLAKLRFQNCRKKSKINDQLKNIIVEKIKQGWSPEQIEGRFNLENKIRLSREAIYRFIRNDKIEGGNIWTLLRRPPRGGKGRYLVRKYKPDWLLRLKERPSIINKRQRVGDWERDTMVAINRQNLLVCVDRKTRYLKLDRINSFNAYDMGVKTKTLLNDFPVHSLTNDNGTEFRDYYMHKCPIYFCDPYKPQQRGTVENTIGLLRQYITLKTDLNHISDVEIQKIEERINLRPRKCLNYETPYEIMFNKRVALAN